MRWRSQVDRDFGMTAQPATTRSLCKKMAPIRTVLMLGTAIGDHGGIGSVVAILRENGLFERNRVEYLATHREGGALRKLGVAAAAWLRCMTRLFCGRVSCLHVHLASRASFWRKLLFFVPAFVLRVPVILHLHGGEFPLFYGNESGALAQWLIRFAFRRAAAVIVLSASWARWVGDTFPGANAVIVHNPVTVPVESGEDRIGEAVLFLGRLGRAKGVLVLLEAAAMLVAAGSPVRLWLGGDGDVEGCQIYARKLGIAERVEFLGWVSGKHKRRLLKTAGVYCLPSFNEGLPISLLEAMAIGLPVVTTPVGGIPEVVSDGVEGFLVAPGDAAVVAARLGELIGDPQLARRMGALGRRKAIDRFAAEVIVPKIEAVYGAVQR
ncbi:glycosyltransferase family 4 protein [Accumulibacter sp.]|jgi:glycosyltransferase involved in cell wall biosynthesis|uniref:glycosyltransferase family 4 protein n=1 Tax=Accumulibacter sp. TaxID=2053492 RepID=UPI001ACF43A5|nr:glycosyltransferase family 4 protein [Accumulibacter sp.]MBN8453663.1 glycosyltransferase family 4 protein [Accumulibacter sp.]